MLIAGGSGLIGSRLISLLVSRGCRVALLSTTLHKHPEAKVFPWNPEKGELDENAFENLHIVINLAGANIGSRRWTKARKKTILDSRIQSGEFLYGKLLERGNSPGLLISMSAVGYYGSVTSDHIYTEQDGPADDFLGRVCYEWEKSTDSIQASGTRTVLLRSGIVLSGEGGALPRMALPVNLGMGSNLGKGHQYLPWIHLEDLCGMILYAIENQNLEGPYNAVAPEHVQQRDFVRILAGVLKKQVRFPGIPAWLIGAVMGKRATLLLHGSRISAGRIMETGYDFSFPKLKPALYDLYQK